MKLHGGKAQACQECSNNVQFEEVSPRKCNVEGKTGTQREKKFKTRSSEQRNWRSGAACRARLRTCEKQSLFQKGSHQHLTAAANVIQ